MVSKIGQIVPPAPDYNLQHLHRHLSGLWDDDEPRKELNALGTRPFKMYEQLLADPKSHKSAVSRIFVLVLDQKAADKSRILELAVRRLADPNPHIRGSAAYFIERAGSAADAAPVAALLSDEEVAPAAARTLVKIGGERELAAFDVWLTVAGPKRDERTREYIRSQRDALAKRLADAKAQPKR